jgi:hypothetical protein
MKIWQKGHVSLFPYFILAAKAKGSRVTSFWLTYPAAETLDKKKTWWSTTYRYYPSTRSPIQKLFRYSNHLIARSAKRCVIWVYLGLRHDPFPLFLRISPRAIKISKIWQRQWIPRAILHLPPNFHEKIPKGKKVMENQCLKKCPPSPVTHLVAELWPKSGAVAW